MKVRQILENEWDNDPEREDIDSEEKRLHGLRAGAEETEVLHSQLKNLMKQFPDEITTSNIIALRTGRKPTKLKGFVSLVCKFAHNPPYHYFVRETNPQLVARVARITKRITELERR